MARPANHLLPGDEIDRKALKQCVARFKHHHGERLQASKQRMTPRQRLVMNVLPLLYHCNHPSLPGYINTTVPAGIPGYRPSTQARQAARQVAAGFREPPYRAQPINLQSIFIMGSTGSIAQNRASDVDLWICCEAHLHPALWPKVHVVNHWARTHGVEMQTFLVDPRQFQLGQAIPGCGTPALLLDEFYRSATLVAGCYPLWWLVPPDAEDRYSTLAARLIEHRFVERSAVIDFGPVPRFPAGELALAAVAELTRALSTPHKSLLKLKLVDAYAHAPAGPTISNRYKQAVYAGHEDPDALDAYVLMLQHLEDHLTRTGETGQLQLIRRLFVRKITYRASLNNPRLLELCRGWGYDSADIDHIRNPRRWPFRELADESQQINSALKAGLGLAQKLQRDADRRQSNGPARDVRTNAVRVNQLTRTVELMTSEPAGAIPRINPSLIPANYRASFAAEQHGAKWLAREGGEIAYSCSRLAELAAWARINGLSAPELPADHPLHKNLSQIWLALVSDPARIHVFANAETDIDDGALQRRGYTLLSRHDDPLDFSGLHQLQVRSIDVLRFDETNAWTLQSCTSAPAVLQCVTELMTQAPTRLSWHAIGSRRRFRIQTRLKNLHTQLHGALRESGDRFVFPFGRDIVCVTLNDGAIATTRYPSESDLRAQLSTAHSGRTTYDRSSLRLSPPG